MSATYALIPAAGRGERFSTSGSNKVFAPLRGRPLLRWAAAAFAEHPKVDGVVIVTGASDVATCRQALEGLDNILAIVAGGETRQASVQIGLFTLGAAPEDIILVHDGARPLVSAAIIDRCIAGVHAEGSAAAAMPVTDTLKRARLSTLPGTGNVVAETLDREGVWAMQTPQAFRYQTLLNAYVAAHDFQFIGTDESSLVERFGETAVHLVPGAAENIKVTRPEDLALAEVFLGSRFQENKSQVRVGFGYDIHRLVPGRRLMLGGVEVPDAQGRGLDGHSDADVLLHALCDALLGAAGLPDIGTLYPNTDPAFAGIASTRLLADVAERLRRQNLSIVNVDATLIAEAPKIAPYVGLMRETIAAGLGLEPSRVGIKATTNEGLGALGQGEGIAAHAVASLIAS